MIICISFIILKLNSFSSSALKKWKEVQKIKIQFLFSVFLFYFKIHSFFIRR